MFESNIDGWSSPPFNTAEPKRPCIQSNHRVTRTLRSVETRPMVRIDNSPELACVNSWSDSKLADVAQFCPIYKFPVRLNLMISPTILLDRTLVLFPEKPNCKTSGGRTQHISRRMIAIHTTTALGIRRAQELVV